jgi:hypothetical protein
VETWENAEISCQQRGFSDLTWGESKYLWRKISQSPACGKPCQIDPLAWLGHPQLDSRFPQAFPRPVSKLVAVFVKPWRCWPLHEPAPTTAGLTWVQFLPWLIDPGETVDLGVIIVKQTLEN